MNCVDWYVASAFCIWDGGRLPTEAEWNYAAAGGDQQRYYPWSDPPTDETIDETRAALANPLPVGSKSPAGDGRWGQADLAGNLAEWVLDYGYNLLDYPVPCVDCANTVEPSDGSRGFRGGSFGAAPEDNYTGLPGSIVPEARLVTLGLRCARQ
jgi:formylglycine-generating enzyme required for sulfatase activity